jgi:hypothetical protein
MLKMFGSEFKFVNIVRDHGMFTTALINGKRLAGGRSITISWASSALCLLANQDQSGDALPEAHKNIRIFRYEDMMLHTEKTLRQLCEFLQIEYTDELLPTRHGKNWKFRLFWRV